MNLQIDGFLIVNTPSTHSKVCSELKGKLNGANIKWPVYVIRVIFEDVVLTDIGELRGFLLLNFTFNGYGSVKQRISFQMSPCLKL